MTSQNPIEALAAGAENVSQSCCECLEGYEEKICQQPCKSVLIAAAVGFLLALLPIGKIIAALGRIASAWAKPALLVLGAFSLVSCLSGRCKASK